MDKTLLFFILAFTSIPIGVLLSLIYKPMMNLIFCIMILSILFFDYTNITFLSHEWYKTATWGFEITAVDLGCIILTISMLLRPEEYKIRWIIPLTIPFALFVLAQIVSWINVDSWTLSNPLIIETDDSVLETSKFYIGLFPLFELFKTLRFFFLLWVCTNFINSRESLRAIAICFSSLIIILTTVSLYQRYIQGIHQVTGGLGQKHLLNVFIGMLSCYLFAQAFATQNSIKKTFYLILLMCSVLTMILTIGRSSLFGLFISLTILVGLSLYKFLSVKNILLVSFLAVCSLLVLIKSYDTVMNRLSIQDISATLGGRQFLNKIAIQMANENIFGVGGGNYAARYVDIVYNLKDVDSISIGHNIYFLNLAEFGYFGLLSYLIIQLRVFQILLINFLNNWNNKKILSILIGILSAFILLQVQDIFHFSSRNNILSLIYFIMVAISSKIYLSQKCLTKYTLCPSSVNDHYCTDLPSTTPP